jgi:serine/threonine protein kinase
MVYARKICGMGQLRALSVARRSSWRRRYAASLLSQSKKLNSGHKILLEQRYGRAVDWWAFGVLTYEMLLGQSPFRGDDEDEIFDAILEDEPLYPITMPRDAVSILQKVSSCEILHSVPGSYVL